MQMLVPSYLEFTIDKLTKEQQKFRDQFTNALGAGPLAEPTRQAFQSLEEQTRKNMAVFRQALAMFNPFGLQTDLTPRAAEEPQVKSSDPPDAGEVEELKRQLSELTKKIDSLSRH